jgi:hypothetical protein
MYFFITPILPLLFKGQKAKLCVAQAANTNNMTGILTVCTAKGNAAHQCAFRLQKQRRSVRELAILRHLTRRPK